MPEQVFNYTGADQSFIVPTYVAELVVEVAGASGGNSLFATGGGGGLVTATIPVVPGSTLKLQVGGRNGVYGGGPGGASNGSLAADLGARGGDHSTIRYNDGTAIILAGGGGGAGGTAATVVGGSRGGAGGGDIGGAGEDGASQGGGGTGAGGGGGGTATAGGAGGIKGGSSTSANPGGAGGPGAGGPGGAGLAGNYSETGGGGGGGVFGGGGGGAGAGSVPGAGGGGGGGASFVYVGGATNVVHTQGVRSGDGYIKLSWGSAQSAAPTNVLPASGAIVSTNTPTLGATVVAQGAAKQRVEWNLATSADFVTNLRVISEPTSDFRVSGATTEDVSLASKLFQGAWYIRARTLDEGGVGSPWSGTQQFTVSHAPSASPVFPSSGQVLAYNALGISISWLFSDPSPDDAQSAYQVIVSDAATGTTVADTGKVGSLAHIANVVIPSSKKNSTLTWKVKVWDNDNVSGNYSAGTTFTVADAPGIAVATMTTVATSAPVISFTFTPVVAPLAQYRVTITKDADSSLVYDSGWVSP